MQVMQFKDNAGDSIRFKVQDVQLVQIVNGAAPLKIEWLKWNPSARVITDAGGVIPMPPTVHIEHLEQLAASATNPECSWDIEGPPLREFASEDDSSELVRLLNTFGMGECAGKLDMELGVTDTGDVVSSKSAT